MEYFSFYSYLAATVAYFLLVPVTLLDYKKNPNAFLAFVPALCSLLWTGYTAFTQYSNTDNLFASESLPFETLRDIAWFFFLSTLLSQQQFNDNYSLLKQSRLAHTVILFALFIIAYESTPSLRYLLLEYFNENPKIRLFSHLLFAILGLVLVEQFYRNSEKEARWIIKFLCISLSALFSVDFIVYSKSLLFAQIDTALWNSRGLINALIVPLLAIGIRRIHTNRVVRITVSRKIMFHSAVLLGAGTYLILMSMAGFYIKSYGGDWGEIAQTIFIFLSILFLSVFFASGKVRAIIRFYVNKHFFHYHYDYRNEWLKLSKTIARLNSLGDLSGFVIKTMADLVDSSGGGLWLKNDQGEFYLSEQRSLNRDYPQIISPDHSLIQFIVRKQWVIDFIELSENPDVYDEVDLSEWTAEAQKVWLIVPLFLQNELEAFVVLTKAKLPRMLNWEDRDLLITVGMQLANALALSHASDALSRARQFEAYNRISAYLVHDLKNLVAQIALIVKNAEKHKHNPEFIDDSIATLENVVTKIEHLLGQLKKGNIKADQNVMFNLVDIMSDVAVQQSGNQPVLQYQTSHDEIAVFGEKEKITAILGHLVQNAQDATPATGSVKLELSKNETQAIIKIIDNGCGMDNKFIAERLFKPFDTTKGNAGMGIGVYEARDYILKHNGTCTVESKVDIGTTFTIQLPLAE